MLSEFAAELYDFLQKDVVRWYPELYKHAKVRHLVIFLDLSTKVW